MVWSAQPLEVAEAVVVASHLVVALIAVCGASLAVGDLLALSACSGSDLFAESVPVLRESVPSVGCGPSGHVVLPGALCARGGPRWPRGL